MPGDKAALFWWPFTAGYKPAATPKADAHTIEGDNSRRTETTHGPHLSVSRTSLRHVLRPHGGRGDPTLRQDHPGEAAALLRAQSVYPDAHHSGKARAGRHRAAGLPAAGGEGAQRLH